MAEHEIPHQDYTRQAEMAAIIFEHQELDRWQRANNFVYRHYGWFFAIGYSMVVVSLISFFVAVPHYSASSSQGSRLLVATIIWCWTGILVILVATARSKSTGWWKAILATLVVLAVVFCLSFVGFLITEAIL